MKHDLLALKPADTPDYMVGAWVGCISWCLGDPDVLGAFRVETNNHWQPGRSGIERMIDEATDADWRFLEEFVRWVNANVWGPVDAPEEET